MKIGVFVYSQTGNTLSVAEKLCEKLKADGQNATLERITIVGDPKGDVKKVAFDRRPLPDGYDAVIFAGQVHAFHLSAPMAAYLSGIGSLEGKKTACFVTQSSAAWLGGNRAIKKMIQLIGEKGGGASGSGIINWSNKKRGEQIDGLVARLGGIFQNM